MNTGFFCIWIGLVASLWLGVIIGYAVGYSHGWMNGRGQTP